MFEIAFCHYNRTGLQRKEAPVATASSYEEAIEKIGRIRRDGREYGQPGGNHRRYRIFCGEDDVTSITPSVLARHAWARAYA